jgi:hypothetical protein
VQLLKSVRVFSIGLLLAIALTSGPVDMLPTQAGAASPQWVVSGPPPAPPGSDLDFLNSIA